MRQTKHLRQLGRDDDDRLALLGELLDEFDVESGSLDEASGVQYGAWWESDFLGFGDGGQGGEVAAGAEDDDGDARAGQAGCGCGQVAAGGRDALGDQDRGLAVAGASGPAEGDGVGGGELVQSSDDVVEEFLGALRVVVAFSTVFVDFCLTCKGRLLVSSPLGVASRR